MGRSIEKLKEREMVVKKNVSGVRWLGWREKLRGGICGFSRELRPDNPDLFLLQFRDFVFQARVATYDRRQIRDVDNPSDGVGCKKVIGLVHRTLPGWSCSDFRA